MPLLNQSVLKVNTRGRPPVQLHVFTWPTTPYVPKAVFYEQEVSEDEQEGQEDQLEEEDQQHNTEKQGEEEEEGELGGATPSGDRSLPAEKGFRPQPWRRPLRRRGRP